ncbi:hypothetical protein HanIR_Chr01g0019581 [Helianthus annuus]|nr:hypothetical protein HanIR_Chr01g0019581 [Helianthus annuus]
MLKMMHQLHVTKPQGAKRKFTLVFSVDAGEIGKNKIWVEVNFWRGKLGL